MRDTSSGLWGWCMDELWSEIQGRVRVFIKSFKFLNNEHIETMKMVHILSRLDSKETKETIIQLLSPICIVSFKASIKTLQEVSSEQTIILPTNKTLREINVFDVQVDLEQKRFRFVINIVDFILIQAL